MENSLVVPDTHAKVLQAFSRAIGREAHVLTQHPDLLWQQMYNRLQWEEELMQALAVEFEYRTTPGAKPWLHLDTPHRESHAVLRTLELINYFHDAAISPDGHLLLSADYKCLQVWDVSNWQVLRKLEGHAKSITCCTFSPDGRMIASGGADNLICIWDAASGILQKMLEGHTKQVNDCAFSPDGRTIVSASTDKKVRLWDVKMGKCRRILKDHVDEVRTCAYSPDGKYIASGGGPLLHEASGDHAVRIWDAETGELVHTLYDHKAKVTSCRFSPDSRLLLTSGSDAVLCVWDTVSGNLLSNLKGHTQGVNDCTFSPDGRLMASASTDNTLGVWETATYQLVMKLEGHTTSVMKCIFSPNGDYLYSSSEDNLKIWSTSAFTRQETGKIVLKSYDGHHVKINSSLFSPDGKTILSSCKDRTARLWEVDTGALKKTIQINDLFIPAYVAFSPDGHSFVSNYGSRVAQYDIDMGKRTIDRYGHEKSVCGCTYSPDGKYILSTSRDKTIRIWKEAGAPYIDVLPGHTDAVVTCTVSPNAKLIVSASRDKTLRVWDYSTHNHLATLEGHEAAVTSCAFSPDGGTLVTADEDGMLRVWDVASWHVVHQLRGHGGYVNGALFTPDGNYIFSVGDDRSVCAWEVITGRRLARMLLLGCLSSIGMHPWKPAIICGDEGGALYILHPETLAEGPVIITPVEKETNLSLLCPACQTHNPITQTQLSTEFTCPTPGCGLCLKINPFVIHMD
jgi:WD40 repeat protein